MNISKKVKKQVFMRRINKAPDTVRAKEIFIGIRDQRQNARIKHE